MFDWRSMLKAIPGARPLGRRLRGVLHPHYRAVRKVERRMPGLLLQPEATTGRGRYREIIAFVAEELAPLERPKVLSWGCSTGEELLALHTAIPHAEILGVDINPRSLAQAKDLVGGMPQIALLLSGDPTDLSGQTFDAVLCLAVLRHARLEEERPESSRAILPFAKAEGFVTSLAALVRPGGLLALWNVHFRLADMAAGGNFASVFELEKGDRANQPLYGPGDRRLDGEVCRSAVYRRRANSPE